MERLALFLCEGPADKPTIDVGAAMTYLVESFERATSQQDKSTTKVWGLGFALSGS